MKQESAIQIMKMGKNVFLTGSAGTGKTYVLNEYVNYLKDRKIKPSIVAPTGIAASHLNGNTIHSFFGLGIRDGIDDYFLDSILQKQYLNERFSKLKVLIIDEVSMIKPEIFEAMDRILKAFKFNNKPFGGVQVVISGDFFQLPPISKVRKEKRFSWQSPAWKDTNLKTCYLKKKYRQDDEKLIKVLDGIRSGEISEEVYDICESCYKKDLGKNYRITKLYTHNVDVDKINMEELEKIDEEERFFLHTSSGTKSNIEKIFKSSTVKEEIVLKIGAIVLFTKNNYEKGYINGTTGVIIDFDKNDSYPIVEIFSGRKIKAEPDDWSFENEGGNIIASVRQIPLKLAWAITIHKSQGMTLDSAEIDLSKTFEVGQGYVALSRVKNIDGLRLMGINNLALTVDALTLKIDDRVKQSSEKSEKELEKISEGDKKKFFDEYIEKIGGLKDDKEIKKEEKKRKEEKKINKDVIFSKKKEIIPTHIKTGDLVKTGLNIKEISKKRDLTEETILNHLMILKKKNIKVPLNQFKPEGEIVEIVEEAVEELKKENDKENFSESGELKLSAIFKCLDEEISYTDIKLSMLFINI